MWLSYDFVWFITEPKMLIQMFTQFNYVPLELISVCIWAASRCIYNSAEGGKCLTFKTLKQHYYLLVRWNCVRMHQTGYHYNLCKCIRFNNDEYGFKYIKCAVVITSASTTYWLIKPWIHFYLSFVIWTDLLLNTRQHHLFICDVV